MILRKLFHRKKICIINKRIVFLSGAYSLQGGGERSLIQLIENIKDRYEIFCVLKKDGELAKSLRELGVEVFFSELNWSTKFKRQFSNYIRLFRVYKLLKKIKPNLIYANSGDVNRFGVILSKLLNIPIITHIRAFFDLPKKDKYLFSKSNVIIACSEAVKKNLAPLKDRVKVVYDGIDKDRYKPYSVEEKKIKKKDFGDYFLVGNIGTINEKKGYLEFIEVANKVCKLFPNIRFLIIGSYRPKEESFLFKLKDKIKEYNLEDKVIFMGFIQYIEKVIPVLDVLLFPTHREGFGRVIIESFACCVPVISTYSGGPQEIIENGRDGFLLKVGDIDGMANAVIRLYKDKNLYDYIIKNAYKKFLDNFTIEKMVEKTISIIEATLN